MIPMNEPSSEATDGGAASASAGLTTKCTTGDLLIHILAEVGSSDASLTNFECPGVALQPDGALKQLFSALGGGGGGH